MTEENKTYFELSMLLENSTQEVADKLLDLVVIFLESHSVEFAGSVKKLSEKELDDLLKEDEDVEKEELTGV